MTSATDFASTRRWELVLWTLRITVVMQCVGNWRWFTQIEETPLLHWMLDPTDIGGLAWSESTAQLIQQIVGWLTLAAASIVLWRSFAPVVLVFLTLMQLLVTVAMWRIADGYSLQAAWAPAQLLILFPFATQTLRIAAPLGLLLLSSQGPTLAVEKTLQLLRWSVAIVFLAHGIEAVQLNPKFIDLMIGSTQRVLGIELTETVAERCLAAIGIIDMVVAVACFSLRSITVMWWIACWGGITAFSRILAYGWDVAWHEAFTRIPHLGVPLAVVLWWHLLKSEPVDVSKIQENHEGAAGSHT